MNDIKKILYIDDCPNPTADMLNVYGYETDVCCDGQSGLNCLFKNPDKYDLILLDIMMPNIDGWSVLKTIRANKILKNIPIIILTAIEDEHKEIKGLKQGADDYIMKPFVFPNLLARIEALLRRSMWNKADVKKKSILNELTQREKEILKLVSIGDSNLQIAEKLFIREITVKTHLNNIYRKIGVENRVQATIFALNSKIEEY